MRRSLAQKHPKSIPSLYRIEQLLRRRFGQPRHGNKINPLDELIYILLSLQTSETNCKRSYAELRRRFSSWRSLADATVSQIREPISFAGLGNQRARKIQKIVRQIRRDTGDVSLNLIKAMPSDDAEAYLTSLHGVGKKTARCILMYSLRRPVFPLDTHCARILKRLGFQVPDGSLRQCEDRIQELVPEELRYSLHVTMISLGRTICKSSKPRCDQCPLQSICAYTSAGIKDTETCRSKTPSALSISG
jgi:endonuclease-3